MKKNFSKLWKTVMSAAVIALAVTACSKDDSNGDGGNGGDGGDPQTNEVVLKGRIAGGTRTLVKDSVYILEGNMYVEPGAILSINPGTVIKGDKRTKGTLVVKPGATIDAVGTENEPIVFTSRLEPGLRQAGDWGGVVICGLAPTNQSNPKVEGLTEDVIYGGTDENHSSGKLRYCRIEFAGIALQPDNEINGLTLCGVGRGTTIDHVQVSYCGDDSFEWFGGNVNCKNLVAYCGLDDEFDTDFGFSGNVQFCLGIRNPRVADVSASNGFESDNNGSGTDDQPYTSAVFSNVTMIGPWKTTGDKNVNAMFGAGMHIRRNSALSCFNSVVAGWNTGVLIDGSTGTSTWDQVTAGNLVLENIAVVGTKKDALAGDSKGVISAGQVAEWFNADGKGNVIIDDNAAAGIEGMFFDVNTDMFTSLLPAANSPLIEAGAGNFTNAKLQDAYFDKTATYKGAFKENDWTAKWCNFDPQNTVY